jgi:hypothetical protein
MRIVLSLAKRPASGQIEIAQMFALCRLLLFGSMSRVLNLCCATAMRLQSRLLATKPNLRKHALQHKLRRYRAVAVHAVEQGKNVDSSRTGEGTASRLRRSTRATVVLAVVFSAAALSAAAQTVFSVDAHIISSGTSMRSTSRCFAVDAAIGEPVAGYSQSPDYALSAGYLASAAANFDFIFKNSFGDCAP